MKGKVTWHSNPAINYKLTLLSVHASPASEPNCESCIGFWHKSKTFSLTSAILSPDTNERWHFVNLSHHTRRTSVRQPLNRWMSRTTSNDRHSTPKRLPHYAIFPLQQQDPHIPNVITCTSDGTHSHLRQFVQVRTFVQPIGHSIVYDARHTIFGDAICFGCAWRTTIVNVTIVNHNQRISFGCKLSMLHVRPFDAITFRWQWDRFTVNEIK